MYKLVTLHERHPLWSILRMGVLGAVAVGALHVTASHFDAGEMTAAGVVIFASAFFDFLKRQFAERM